jgi:hypothetical protein
VLSRVVGVVVPVVLKDSSLVDREAWLSSHSRIRHTHAHTSQVDKLSKFLTEGVTGVQGKDVFQKKVVPQLDTRGQGIKQLWRIAPEARPAAQALSAAEGIEEIFCMEAGTDDGKLKPVGLSYILTDGLKHDDATMQHVFVSVWPDGAAARACA